MPVTILCRVGSEVKAALVDTVDIVRLGRGVVCVAGGRALRVKPVGLFAVGVPAANSLSRIFVRIGCRLDGLPFTIPDSMPDSLDFYC